MVKVFKIIFVFTISSMFLFSCSTREARSFVQLHSVIKSSADQKYFSSDQGISLFPANGIFNPDWGKEGDRVIVGFYYDPYAVSENTKRMDITVETLVAIETHSSALRSDTINADSLETGSFLRGYSGNPDGIYAWTAQNYLTAVFFVQYENEKKHSFGFIADPQPFSYDTLHLTMWHKSDEKVPLNKIGQSYLALNLSDYKDRLSMRDSTVISIKYKSQNYNSSTVEDLYFDAIYRKKDN
jgi:hypothetical protein